LLGCKIVDSEDGKSILMCRESMPAIKKAPLKVKTSQKWIKLNEVFRINFIKRFKLKILHFVYQVRFLIKIYLSLSYLYAKTLNMPWKNDFHLILIRITDELTVQREIDDQLIQHYRLQTSFNIM